MAIKKSELYSSLWQSCDELRGGMDASQYKDYVLVLLFLKYVSDKFSGKPYAPIVIPPGASFTDMVALKGKSDIGDQINKKILGPLALANKLSDMPDFNDPAKLGDGKEKVDRLTNLIAIFENPALDFSQNRADGDDLLGDAYEYLMRHFATESGKSKGQFYTPAEVSRIMAQILGIRNAKTTNETTVYDPTCGSGSLLLKIGDEAQRGKDVKVTLYGQEKDNATAGLARMNMILHDYATADIKQGNTLANPLFTDGAALKTFDYVVANPPFSDKRWSTGLTPDSDPYGRFEGYGIPPSKQGDYAYLLHILRSIKPNGKGACILPHGVLFRGNAEAVIRRNLIQRGLIKGVIGLPANLFYGTGIPACIILLDKEGANARKGIFMIDASKGFRKDGPKNRLREQDLHRIVDTFTNQMDIPGFSRMVPVAEISDAKNDYNLNLPRFIDSTEPEDLQDIEGHLRGGIPNRDLDALEEYWKVIPAIRNALFENSRSGYSQLRIPTSEIKATIFSHAEFTAFNDNKLKLFNAWKAANISTLKSFDKDGHPKALIESIAKSLLVSFENAALLNCYDIYQHLMDYWVETMQDDCYLIAADGWKEAAQPKILVEEKGKKNKVSPDFIVGKKKYIAELIPPALLIARYFSKEWADIDALKLQQLALEQQLEEMIEEHCSEGGFFEDAKNEKDKLTHASASARLKEIKADNDAAEELQALENYLAFIKEEKDVSSKLKTLQEALTTEVASKYGQLTAEEVKTFVVEEKWIATLASSVQGELDRVSQTLTNRIQELVERYISPLPSIVDEVAVRSNQVNKHLRKLEIMCKSGLKEADLQQLLAGDMRLPGFSGEWKELSIREHATIKARIGWQALTTEEYLDAGKYYLVTGTDFINGRVNWSSCHFVSEWRFSQDKNIQLADGDILVTKDGTIGKVGFVENLAGQATLNSGVFVIRPKKMAFHPLFLFYVLRSRFFKDFISEISAGSTITHLYQKDFINFKFSAPCLEEQIAIAQILSDMDAEISALEKQLDKILDLRKGMMQELLTERVALI